MPNVLITGGLGYVGSHLVEQLKKTNNEITLLVEDKNVLYKPKTTSQRSDGFKQFVSFLLTISIENNNDELYKTVLLIDEPEVHLHPPAQISLLNELIKITSNDRNNLLFFATHSNYLIDKTNLDRYFKVFKHNNEYLLKFSIFFEMYIGIFSM